MPSAPTSIYTPPTAGAAIVAPRIVFAEVFKPYIRMVITGVTTAGVNGTMAYAGTDAGKHSWSSDGTHTESPTNVIMSHNGTRWELSLGSTYLATKVSNEDFPNPLTAWTVTVGVGSPSVSQYPIDGPDVVKVSYVAPTVSAPALVFVP